MFTGIVEETGKVVALSAGPAAWRLKIAARTALAGVAAGDSIAVNGCCLTVVEVTGANGPRLIFKPAGLFWERHGDVGDCARQAMDLMFRHGGSTSFKTASRLAEVWRDLQVVGQAATLAPEWYPIGGRAFLGLDPGPRLR